MSKVGQIERATQNRIVALFQQQLHYRYLGNLEKEEENSNVDEALLTKHLTEKGYNSSLISKALFEFKKIVTINTNDDLYQANKNVYAALRYGINVKEEAGQNKTTVHLIDWNNPQENDFAIAEEVTVNGNTGDTAPVNLYSKVDRSVKYGFLFIGFTFLAAASAPSFHTGLLSKNTSVCSCMPNANGLDVSTLARNTEPGA